MFPFAWFPNFFHNFGFAAENQYSLRRLVFNGTSGHANKVLKVLPESLGELKNLQELVLDKCKALEELPSSIGYLTRLVKLSMKECKKVQQLPDSIGSCRALVELDLSKCIELKSLPSSIGDLTNLEDLVMMKCLEIQVLPESIGRCGKLAKLDMTKCIKLTSLPYSVERLVSSSLNELTCEGCQLLTSAPSPLLSSEHQDVCNFSKCPSLQQAKSESGA